MCDAPSLRKIICLLLLLLALPLQAAGPGWTHPGPLKADSSNFVTASLLVTSPGQPIYSNLGHCTLRMECPQFKLDYCFSFETDAGTGGIVRFFAGQDNGHIVAVPTAQYLQPYAREGREVKQYVLNLTPHERQELWRLLDNDMVADENRKFNFLRNNCASISLQMVDGALMTEHFNFVWPDKMNQDNAGIVRTYVHEPWSQFLGITLLGTENDVSWDNVHRIAPEAIIPILQHSTIEDLEGHRRPALTGEVSTLLPLRMVPTPSPVTPTLVFALLLGLTVLLTVLEWKPGWHRPAQVLDVALFVGQTGAGLLLLYMSTVSCLFGTHWNWYLLAFNPVPLLLWLLLRKRKGYRRVWLLYSIVLAGLLLATPLSSQFDLPHQLLIATLLVRSFAHLIVGTGHAPSARWPRHPSRGD